MNDIKSLKKFGDFSNKLKLQEHNSYIIQAFVFKCSSGNIQKLFF